MSTVAGERGAADAERDIGGFALKVYTEEGNWDLLPVLGAAGLHLAVTRPTQTVSPRLIRKVETPVTFIDLVLTTRPQSGRRSCFWPSCASARSPSGYLHPIFPRNVSHCNGRCCTTRSAFQREREKGRTVLNRFGLVGGAGGRNRTGTGFTPRDFESRASTNFTTPALESSEG